MPGTLIALVDDLRLEFTPARVSTSAVLEFDGYDVDVEKRRAKQGDSPAIQRTVACRFRRQLALDDVLHLQKIIAHAAERLIAEQRALDGDLRLGIGPNPTHRERFEAQASKLPGCMCEPIGVLAGIHGVGCAARRAA
jgi:hypothetical protein